MLGLIGADSGMSGECKVAPCIKCEIIKKRRLGATFFFFLLFSFAFGATFEVHFNTSYNTSLHDVNDQNYYHIYYYTGKKKS